MKYNHLVILAVVLAVGYFVGVKYPTLVSSTIAKVA